MASATREVIVHELGHVVFDLALDERGRRAFRSAFVRTGWRNAPFVPPSEQFADQLAHWALGEESTDPRWLERPSSRDCCASTRATARCRPVAYFLASHPVRAPRFSFANGGSQPIGRRRRAARRRLIHD